MTIRGRVWDSTLQFCTGSVDMNGACSSATVGQRAGCSRIKHLAAGQNWHGFADLCGLLSTA